MTHEGYKEMLAIIALATENAREGDKYNSAPAGFVDDFSEAERDALDVHLAACAECRNELASLRDSFAMLAHTAPSVMPPVNLREKILARIHGENSGDNESGAPTFDMNETENAPAPHPVSNVVPLTTGRPRPLVETDNAHRRSAEIIPLPKPSDAGVVMKSSNDWLLKFGLLAASVALAAAIIGLFGLWQRNDALNSQIAQAAKQQQATSDELARIRADENILTASDARTRQLSGTAIAPQAHANLAYDKQTGRAVLYASNLPPAPAGKAYQIWYIANGKPLPGKVFNADANGRVTLHDNIPTEGRNAAIFAVTLEPETGVQTPTGEKYLLSATS